MTKKSRRVAKARRVLLALSLVLVTMVVAVGGTIAWLTDSTGTVTNTFSGSGINVDLVETDSADEDTDAQNNSYQIVPGVNITKDPKVSASADVPYYVFVSVTETNIPDWEYKYTNDNGEEVTEKKVSYTLALTEANGWKVLKTEGDQTIYYKEMEENQKLTDFSIIVNDTIYVSSQVTKEELVTLTTKVPQIVVKAYAIQKANSATTNFTAAEAWDEVQ